MSADDCVPNIGPAGRRLRMRFGVITLVLTVGVGVAMLVLDVERPWRLAVFLPLFGAGTGIFQARGKT